MAELGIEELRRLARNFLIGKGGEAELEDTKRAMESEAQLAMEFLQQMQTALDDAPPAGFNPEQWKDIDARVAALISPLAKGGLGLGFIGKFFAKLFKKKPAAEASGRIKRGGAPEESKPRAAASESPTSLLSSEAVVAPPSAGEGEGEAMEEMAPIAPVAAPPALPGLDAARAAAEKAPLAAPAEVAASATPELAAPSASKGGSKKWIGIIFVLLAALLLAYGGWMAFNYWASHKKPAALPVALPTPLPTPYSGPPRRSQPPAEQTEPLPSELPPMTPQPAGHVSAIPNLDAKDKDGRRALPLP